MTKKALGKGLKAFIPEEYGILKEERYAEVDVDELRPNPLQPRLKFDSQTIGELAQSMKETGVIQPILVVPEEDHYKIIVGERRWRAAQAAGLQRVPVVIRNIPVERQLEISLIENIHREELNPLEIALAYQRLIHELNYTQQDIAEKVGKDRTSVTNYLRLLKLPKEVQDFLADSKISMGHARALLGLEDPKLQLSLCRRIVQKNISVREVEKMVQKLSGGPPAPKEINQDPDLAALQEELLKLLKTKVFIAGNRNRGVLKVYYFSLEELNRIYSQMKGAVS
jgi:ParB family chromosome partitioning protein